jgi:hypothetical protein
MFVAAVEIKPAPTLAKPDWIRVRLSDTVSRREPRASRTAPDYGMRGSVLPEPSNPAEPVQFEQLTRAPSCLKREVVLVAFIYIARIVDGLRGR